jgi:hypothetical protein
MARPLLSGLSNNRMKLTSALAPARGDAEEVRSACTIAYTGRSQLIRGVRPTRTEFYGPFEQDYPAFVSPS